MISTAFVKGFTLCLSLIVAIGPQNAFILRAGTSRRHAFLAAWISAFCDLLLTALGAFGLGALLAQNPIWVSAARWAGAMYLFYLGGRMVVQAVQEASRKSGLGVVLVPRTAAHAVRLALGFALLNPHVYLDTVGLMGAASARYAAPARMLFVAGAAAASLLWFNFLVVVGVLVSKWLESPSVRRWFDCGVGLILFGSAIWLICS